MRTKALIGIGASVTANCEPCLQRHGFLQGKYGVNEQEIVNVIALGQMLRKGVAGKMNKFAASVNFFVPVANGSEAGT